MATIVEGLFGLTPSQVQKEQVSRDYALGREYAQMTPTQRANVSLFQAGAGVGRGFLGLAGFEDEETVLAKQASDIQKQIDHSTPEGLMRGAQLFNQAGNPRMAAMYQQAAAVKEQERQRGQLTQAQTLKELALAEKAGKTSEEDPMKYVGEYGRLVELWKKAPEGSAEKSFYKQRIDALNSKEKATAASMPKPPTGYRFTAEGDLEPIPGGPKDTAGKEAAAKERARAKAQLVISKINEALEKVSPMSAGIAAQATGNIAGSPAYNLKATVDTIVANIGFDELAAMRQASPTGGALGQVAVRELDMLQATLSSLKTEQGPAQLRANLEKVLDHYKKWLATVNESAAQEGGAPINPEAKPKKRVKFGELK